MNRATVLLLTIVLLFGIMAQVAVIKAEGTNTEGSNTAISATSHSDDNESETQTEIQVETHDDGETEVQVEIQDENGMHRELKIKGNETEIEEVKAAIRERNRLRFGNDSELPENCTRDGSSIKCNIEGGRVMAVFAGNSGNTIIQVQGVNMSTQVELYHHNGGVYGVLDDNNTILLNYFPDQIREQIRERIRARIGNETINLTEDGEYQVEVQKEARFLGLFKVKEKVRFHVDPANGTILNEHAPWWGFLAKDVQE